MELEHVRVAEMLPRVDWDAVSDFSGSDSDEEREQRLERHRKRRKELEKRSDALVRARRLRPVASGVQRRGKQPTRRQETGDSIPSPQLTPGRVQPKRVASLRAEGATYKE